MNVQNFAIDTMEKKLYLIHLFYSEVVHPLYILYKTPSYIMYLVCLFDLILYLPSTIFQLCRHRSS